MIHCSGEDGTAAWAIGADNRFLYFKQYGHGRFRRKSDLEVQLPLGFLRGMFDSPYLETESWLLEHRTLPWAFAGSLKKNRAEMLKAFRDAMPKGRAVTDFSIGPSEVKELYRNAILVPNGRGVVNIDCFRLFEAMFNWAIPVTVCDPREFVRAFAYNGDPAPILRYDSWPEAADSCRELLNQPRTIQELQHRVLAWISRTVLRIRSLIRERLPLNRGAPCEP